MDQIDDLIDRIRDRVERGERALVTTLTKQMAEDLADYLHEMGVKVAYLHSEVDTLERVQILRQAFMATMRDAEFLAEAKKSKLDINPLPGESTEKTVAGIFQLNQRLVAKLKEILK